MLFAPGRGGRRKATGDRILNEKQMYNLANFRAGAVPVGFCLNNTSGTVAKRVRFVGSLRSPHELKVERNANLPDPCQLQQHPNVDDVDLFIRKYGDHYEITVDFGDVRPQDQALLLEPIWIHSRQSQRIELVGQLRADNLPTPVTCSLDVSFNVQPRPVEIGDLQPFFGLQSSHPEGSIRRIQLT